MSSQQSGPYQSQLLRFAVRQTRQWLDQSRVMLRRVTTVTRWTGELLLHTLLGGVRALRLAGSSVRQGVALGMADSTLAQEPVTVPDPAAALTSSSPIQHSLQALQCLPIDYELPILFSPPAASLVAVSGSRREIVRQSIARIVRACRSPLRPSLPQPPAHYIQAIASQLTTRTLVLVTNQNQIFDILTPDQQTHLRQRIAWETDHYDRYHQLRQQTRPAVAQLAASLTDVAESDTPRFSDSLLASLHRLLSKAPSLAFWRSQTPTPAQTAPEPLFSPLPSLVITSPAKIGAIVSPPSLTETLTPAYGFWNLVQGAADLSLAESGESAVQKTSGWADWIDIQATSTGYVLTPLDELLRMVDRGLLWLETRLVQFWQPQQWLNDWHQSSAKKRVNNWFAQLRIWLSQRFHC